MTNDERNQSILKQLSTTFSQLSSGPYGIYTPLTVAGVAVLGSALYYYLNNANGSSNLLKNLIDYKKQTRELEVINSLFFSICILALCL